MRKHKMSVWYSPDFDEELARQDAYEEWLRQVEHLGYVMVNEPRVHVIRSASNMVTSASRSRSRVSGFKVHVQGDIKPKDVGDDASLPLP